MRNGALERRLARLEAKARTNPEAPRQVLVVRFVKPNGQYGGQPCDSYHAEADGQVWHREPSETLEEFEERVLAAVRASAAAVRARDVSLKVVYFCPAEERDGLESNE